MTIRDIPAYKPYIKISGKLSYDVCRTILRAVIVYDHRVEADRDMISDPLTNVFFFILGYATDSSLHITVSTPKASTPAAESLAHHTI